MPQGFLQGRLHLHVPKLRDGEIYVGDGLGLPAFPLDPILFLSYT
jgi:hypothetical protein